MNLCVHAGPGPPCSALALSAAGMLLCDTGIKARRRVHWSWCGSREFCQSHLLREVRGHRQRNVVLIFWAKKFYKIIFPIFWCEAWRKIIIKQNWRREGYSPNDIFPVLSASFLEKRTWRVQERRWQGTRPLVLLLIIVKANLFLEYERLKPPPHCCLQTVSKDNDGDIY